MGRSGGLAKRKLAKRDPITRSGKKGSQYIKEKDHDQLVCDAVTVWLSGSRALLDPKKARNAWRADNKEEAKDPDNPKNSIDYWKRAYQAFLFSVKNSSPGEGPFFRGQSFRSGNPLNRIRSWSRTIEAAFDFSHTKPRLEGPKGHQDTKSLKSLIRLALRGEFSIEEGEKLSISFFVLPQAPRGMDVSKELGEKPREILIENLEKGRDMLCEVKKDGKWAYEKFSLDKEKVTVAEVAINLIGKEKVAEVIGLDKNAEKDQIIRKAASSDSCVIEEIIQATPSEDLLVFWKDAKDNLIQKANDTEVISPSIFCASEEEVILDPETAPQPKRINIVVARSTEDLAGRSFDQIKGRFKQEIEHLLPTIEELPDVFEVDISGS